MEIIKYYHVNKGTLQSFITLKIPKWGGFIIENIGYFVKGDRRWINLPQQIHEDNGNF